MTDRPVPVVTLSVATSTETSHNQPYLLIITREHARRQALEGIETVVLGRGDDAGIRVEDSSVSREHAQLDVSGSRMMVRDLGSHNGTHLNGERIEKATRVVSGDVITLGEATVVVRTAGRAGARLPVQAVEELTLRLNAEVSRAMRYERPLSVVALSLSDEVNDHTFTALMQGCVSVIDIVGRLGDGTIVAVLPEVSRDAAASTANLMLQSILPADANARAGVAAFPRDGGDGQSLVEAARAAVPNQRDRENSGVGLAGSMAQEFQLHGRLAVVAEPSMLRIYDLLRRLAGADLPVLVNGETGVGKELAARALHGWSARAKGPFIAVNCAALPETLAESELFGHRRGAFTGAVADKTGYVEAASGGTLFLDEVGELSPAIQAKLLRALDSGEVTRVGDTSPVKVDVRIVAATNRDLQLEIREGRFREDLYYRLCAATVVVPPLRDRPRDVLPLANSLLTSICAEAKRPTMSLSDAALRALLQYSFPGNVRELANAVRYAVATADEDTIQPWHLPGLTVADQTADASMGDGPGKQFRDIADEVEALEKRRMQEALEVAGGVQSHAAELIGMPRRTFTTKMRKYKLREG